MDTRDSQEIGQDTDSRKAGKAASEYQEHLKRLLVDLIKSNGSLTQSEMATKLNVSARTIRRLISETKEIVRIGSKKKGSWIVWGEKDN